jgi:excisionase family DNA binding protein
MPIKFTEKYLTTTEAAKRLGIARDSVGVYCGNGRIKAEKVGHSWLIPLAEVEKYETEEAATGRPKKSHSA